MMQMAQPMVIDKAVDAARLHHIMAGDRVTRWPHLPIEIVSTGLPDIIMPVHSVNDLQALRPDHVRNFGPLYGVPEESATGTANAALTHWLQRRGRVQLGEECRFVQGEAMGRPSVVATTLRRDGTIWVGGTCCIVARGSLLE